MLTRRAFVVGSAALLAGCAWTDSKLAKLRRDPMASWQPAEPHTEEVDEIPDSGVMEGPTGSRSSTLQRRLTFESAEVADKVAKDAMRAALASGWSQGYGPELFYRGRVDMVILIDVATVHIALTLSA